MPRWLAWMGLIIAALAELSAISLVFPEAFVLLPVARLSSFIWLIGTGFTMTKKMSVSH